MKKLNLVRLISSALAVTSLFSFNPVAGNAAWKENSNGWWYSHDNGWYTGWKMIDGKWYYFNPETGYMKTGWLNDKGTWYYLSASGEMVTGWINYKGAWFYNDSNGAMQTGVIKVVDKLYVLADDGTMHTGKAVVDGKEYLLNESGEIIGQDYPDTFKEFSKEGIYLSGSNTQNDIKQEDNSKAEIENDTKNEEAEKEQSSSGSSSKKHSSSSSSKKETFLVKFKGEGTENLKNIYVNKNNTVKLPVLEREGYIFKGWYIDKESKFDENTKIDSNILLYAKWIKNNEIDHVDLVVPSPVVGSTPKNVSVIDKDADYFVIANEWYEIEYGTTSIRKMKPDDKFIEGNSYFPAILLKAKYGYNYTSSFEWVTGACININGKQGMPNFVNKLSQMTIVQINLYPVEAVKPETEAEVNTDIELNDDVDFSLDVVDENTNIEKQYIQIVYDKDTLEINGCGTGTVKLEDNQDELFVEYNLKNWYFMNNSSEYMLIRDDGGVRLVKKYNQPVTVCYKKDTLEIKDMMTGVVSRWEFDYEEDENKYDFDVIVVDAELLDTTNKHMVKNKDNYELIKDNEEIRIQRKAEDAELDTDINEGDDISDDNLIGDIMNDVTTSAAVSIEE